MASTKGAYQDKLRAHLVNGLTFQHRNFAGPLDDTLVWNTLDDLIAYINMPGTYAYPGQLVAVANGTIEHTNGNKEYSLYMIRSDMSLQPVSGTRSYTNAAEAEENIDNLEIGMVLSVWNERLERHELFTVEYSTEGNGKKELQRQSFNEEDLPDISWKNLTGKPESSPDDIDSAVTFSKKFEEDDAGSLTYDTKKLAYVSDIPTEYDVAKLSGIISVDNLPAGALERCMVVADEETKNALSLEDVQAGDTVKVQASGQMYFVKGVTEDGKLQFEPYTATAATSVPWSGVLNKPTSVDGYGIKDAVKTTDVTDVAEAGKLLRLDAEGKLPADITGDAATLGGHPADYYAKAEDTTGAVDGLTEELNDLTTTVNGIDSRTTTVENSLETHNNQLLYLGTVVIPRLQDGTDVKALAATKLTGIVDRKNLPSDVSGMTIEVADENARGSLTNDTVHNGWLVKELSTGYVYSVVDDTKLDSEAGYIRIVAIGEEMLDWGQIVNTPTTLAGYGIIDGVNSNDVTRTATPNKLLMLNGLGKLPADITGDAPTLGGHPADYFAKAEDAMSLDDRVTAAEATIHNLQNGTEVTQIDASKIKGIISVDNLPHAVMERMFVFSDDSARLTLTNENVQNGDTVKVQSTGQMYYVVDDTKLTSEDGYEKYTASKAAAVEWTGVLNRPTTLNGYGITDAVNSNMLVTTASAANQGKILTLNSAGKLDVQITGAVTWSQLTGKPSSTVANIDAAVTAATHSNRAILDKFNKTTYSSVEHATYNSKTLATIDDATTIAATAAANLIRYGSTTPSGAANGTFWIQTL